jgi:hypothetical protein
MSLNSRKRSRIENTKEETETEDHLIFHGKEDEDLSVSPGDEAEDHLYPEAEDCPILSGEKAEDHPSLPGEEEDQPISYLRSWGPAMNKMVRRLIISLQCLVLKLKTSLCYMK